MKVKNWLFFLLLTGAFAFSYRRESRLAYVRSEVLVNEFDGMKEARQSFQRKQGEWQQQLDTLRADYQRGEAAGVPAAELEHLASNIRQYSNRVAVRRRGYKDYRGRARSDQCLRGSLRGRGGL
jgi:Skp family chaperone for outer membrane proteins